MIVHVFHQMKRLCYVIVVCLLWSFVDTTPANAQATAYFTDTKAAFSQAVEHFQQERYQLAMPLFRELYRDGETTSEESLHAQEIKFYLLACGLKLNDERAVVPAATFIDVEKNAPLLQQLSYELAQYYFRKQNYADAVTYYEKAGIAQLSNAQIAEAKFNTAYAYFHLQRLQEAKPLFNSIRQLNNSPHYADANYYYGFIAYNDREYGDARNCFEKVQNHPKYGRIVPFYLASIYYMGGQKEKAVDVAEAALKKPGMEHQPAMYQLLAHAYFEKQDFRKALSNMEKYVNAATKISRDDQYKLSYCYYATGQYRQAIDGFKQLSGSEDSLSQSAMYLLGIAYLQTGEKENARNAFAFCAANTSNATQREISLFHYAKLSYELGYQGLAISKLRKFIQAYPTSTYQKEAKELLVAVLSGTNNYKDALDLLETMENPGEDTRKLYANILYGRATEYINDQQLDQAEALLDKILKEKYNAAVLPMTYFWKGEIAFRKGKTDEAIRYFNNYLQTGHKGLGEVSPLEAQYNLGYCYMQKENYSMAASYLQKAVTRVAANAPVVEQDAYLRLADCYFMMRNYKAAQSMYQQVLDFAWPAADYALYQKAIISGISSSKTKIELLNLLQRQYPTSDWVTDANMEIARTYMADENFREAIPYLQRVVNDVRRTGMKQQALLQMGIAYYNINRNEDALAQYRRLLQEYPNTEEAEEAIENVRSIYVEAGQPAAYENFLRAVGKQISTSEADSLTYIAAELKWNEGNCNEAVPLFDQYIQRFAAGKYALQAHYYRSECYMQRKDWKNALPGYEYVARQGNSRFAERAALQSARTYYFELKDYEKAETYFSILGNVATTDANRLEALRGLLRCLYQQKKYTAAAVPAKELLVHKSAGTDDKALSNLIVARNFQEQMQYEQALQAFRNVVNLNKGEWAAEARYSIALIYFEAGNLAQSEKAAFEVINKSGSYDYWVTSAYILLGDIFFRQKDYFNAKATYKSVAENALHPVLKQQAAEKLEKVIAEEKKQSKIED